MPDKFLDKHFNLFLVIVILTNATGLFNDILEPDGMLYANISRQIALSGNWINLYVEGKDWLDKPHLPFWITALSFKILGISSFAYKLPAFLSWLLSLYFIYKLAITIYEKTIAKMSVLIYGTALHATLANFDVRAEPYLVLFIIMATYFLLTGYLQDRIKYLLLAGVCTAAAIMTKGIFTVLTIGGGFFFYFILTKKLRELLHYRWLLFVIVTCICCLPELYSLYVQFDLHPEKVVFGKTNVSGIRFFLWDSQFGRFFNTGPIKGSGDVSFFVHTTLWAFLPWSFIFIVALIQLVRKPQTNSRQYIIIASAALTFLLFSFSKFQLPHYIIIIFPHFAMLTASYIRSVSSTQAFRIWSTVSTTLLIILASFITLLVLYSGLINFAYVWLPFVLLAVTLFRKDYITNLIWKAVMFSSCLFIFLNLFFYPALLKYQSGMVAAKECNKKFAGMEPILYKDFSLGFQFYADKKVTFLAENPLITQPTIVYTAVKNLDSLTANGYRFDTILLTDDFPVSRLTLNFLNPKTRQAELTKRALIKLYPVNE